MRLFISKRTRIRRTLRRLVPVVLLALVTAVFCVAVQVVSRQSLTGQKEALERVLRQSAVNTYALTGAYPESLEELLSSYHITYNPEHFLVEYTPTGSNLFPGIFVLSLRGENS